MRKLNPIVASASAAAIALGMVAIGSGTASAATVGGLTFAPTSGTLTTSVTVKTSAACPTGTTQYDVSVADGPSGWAGTQLVSTGSTGLGTLTTAGAPVDNLANIAAANSLTIAQGLYTYQLTCYSASFAETGNFQGTFYVSSTTGNGAWAAVKKVSTTTTVSATPASAVLGDNVTLAANVATVGTTTATLAGTVTFTEGSTVLGSAPLAGGAASITVNNLAVGSHSVSASFVATNAAVPADQIQDSASASPAPVSITPVVPTLSGSTSPAAGSIYTTSNVSIPVTITPAIAGAFTVNVTSDGSPITCSNLTAVSGAASCSLGQLAQGTYAAAVDFTPANTTNYATPQQFTFTFNVGSIPATRVGTEVLRTTVADGALTITVQGVTGNPTSATGTAGQPGSNIVVLPDAILDAAGQFIVTTGDMIPVQVTDTRAGDLGYNVTGSVDDFVSGANRINAQNLGWTPKFVSSTRVPGATTAAGAGLTGGSVVAPADGVLPADAGSLGLKTARTLYTAPAGGSTGTVLYGATLKLKAPTTTVAGAYQATLTLTANGTGA